MPQPRSQRGPDDGCLRITWDAGPPAPAQVTPVLRVFALTGIDRMIPNFTTLLEALTQPPTTTKGHSRQRTEGDARAEDQPVYAVARR